MNLFEYDNSQGVELLCGVDEAGRGPLAGDVYAAAVILSPNCIIEGINDSKKLNEKKREELYDIIKAQAVSYCVGIATIAEIEEYNILQATFLAMNRAVDGLNIAPKLVLVDGNQNPHLKVHSRCVVKGDATSACIAAASILAKVERDRYMKKVAEQYPDYQFAKHKGYGTTLHYEMLDQFGISDVHRHSFLKKYLSGEKSESKRRGDMGEQTTADYLKSKGYAILFCNYHSAYGEVDIIAQKDDIIAFVEVKSRKENSLLTPREAVSKAKQQKLIKTANCYMEENKVMLQPRFDVVEVYFTGNKKIAVTEINHIENAFGEEN
ncbi:MAG: ribonuclease HII [Oscillospiraceae bacterium]